MKVNVIVVTPNEKGDYTRIQFDRWAEPTRVKSLIASARKMARGYESQGVPAKVLVDRVEVS